MRLRQYIPEEFCLSCKGCCRFAQQGSLWAPALLREELASLVCDDKIPPMAVARDTTLRLVEVREGNVYVCPLFDTRAARCNLYTSRPFECQLYPFLVLRKGRNIFLALHTQCRFVAAHGDESGFKEYGAYMLDFFQKQGLVCIKNNPHIAREYPREEIRIIAPLL